MTSSFVMKKLDVRFSFDVMFDVSCSSHWISAPAKTAHLLPVCVFVSCYSCYLARYHHLLYQQNTHWRLPSWHITLGRNVGQQIYWCFQIQYLIKAALQYKRQYTSNMSMTMRYEVQVLDDVIVSTHCSN